MEKTAPVNGSSRKPRASMRPPSVQERTAEGSSSGCQQAKRFFLSFPTPKGKATHAFFFSPSFFGGKITPNKPTLDHRLPSPKSVCRNPNR
ncbi:hypothetical protein [Enterococcus faecalis]|uniref:hypothetical protein n=1 Tax=Enterococcus faecalis TaxID=1351 RepID=UPI002302EB3F|nr:hypothetical protein [Enterococcus faecalis]